MNKNKLLEAMKADAIPAGESGLWWITKTKLEENTKAVRRGKPVLLPFGSYTALYRLTESTIYVDRPGEVVMEDTPFELKTHLGFVMKAHGNVLITGLGLGCVIRGALANPNVKHVTCIENSEDVLKLVAHHMPLKRLTIIKADALEWSDKNTQKFDCAWHDLWTDQDNGQPHLDHWHGRLLVYCSKFVKQQGAWGFNRQMKTMLVRKGLISWIG